MTKSPHPEFDCRQGELVAGGLPISEIVAEHGTPLYVYDRDVLQRKWNLLRKTLPERFTIHYSVKANPNQRLIRFFLEQGAGVEIASGGELHQVLAAGADPESILFAGPGKTDAELAYAVRTGIREIHVESWGELRRLELIAGTLGKAVPIGVRINPSQDVQGAAMRMGGKPSPFGVDESQLDDFVRDATACSNVELRGVHLFMGTQILDPQYLAAQYHNAVRLARQVTAQTGRPLATLDFGGGLGVPYFAHEAALDLEPVSLETAKICDELDRDPLLANTQCVVEPGRFLTAECGIYVARVIDLKSSRGKLFAVLDGGMHHHLAASGNLGQTIKRNYPISVLNRLDEPCDQTVELVGPLCTPLDCLGRAVELPRLDIGDLVGVFQSGAYGRTSSPHGFLSHAAPAEVLAADGVASLIRRRGEFDDNLRDQPSTTAGSSFLVLPPASVAPGVTI